MSANIYRDQNSVTTLLAIENQLTAALGIDMTLRKATTINTKFGVLQDVVPSVVPRIRYFGIGIGGYANLTSENNIAQPFMPKPTEIDLYKQIPFRCVEDPLDEETAKKYVIRTYTQLNNGKKYYCYWLKKIEFESSVVRLTKIQNEIEQEYTMDDVTFDPKPTDLYPTDVSRANDRVTASVTGICRITGEEVVEVINAMYGGDMRLARISEIGTYSGIPYQVKEDPITGLPAAEEAIYVQMATHKCTTGQQLSDPSAYYLERKSFESGVCTIL